MSEPLVKLHSVTKQYGRISSRAALANISFEGCTGELVLILGPSGSGKTTLLLIAAGFLRPSSGSVFLFGKDASLYAHSSLHRLRADRIGFVFQNHRLLDALSAEENVALAASFCSLVSRDSREAVTAALQSSNIEHKRFHKVRDLSHGERQRVAIARSIVNAPSLLLADEPTASLESAQGLVLFEFYRSFARDNDACVVVASHDERLCSLADRIVRLRDGELFETGRDHPTQSQLSDNSQQ